MKNGTEFSLVCQTYLPIHAEHEAIRFVRDRGRSLSVDAEWGGINDGKTRNTAKFTRVQGGHCVAGRKARGRDQEIVGADHLSVFFQVSPDSCVLAGLRQVEGENGEILNKLFNVFTSPLRPLLRIGSFNSVQKFGHCDGGQIRSF